MDWLNWRALYIAGICIFWIAFVLIKYKANPTVLEQWGIQKQNLKQSFLFLLPFTLICIAGIGTYGYFFKTFTLNWHIIPIFILYPLWGLIQQFMITGLISGNLTAMNKHRLKNYQITLVTSFLFCLVHYPGGFLMLFTFIMQWVFITAFLRWKNIWTIGLYHGWIATLLLYYVMGRDLWIELFASF